MRTSGSVKSLFPDEELSVNKSMKHVFGTTDPDEIAHNIVQSRVINPKIDHNYSSATKITNPDVDDLSWDTEVFHHSGNSNLPIANSSRYFYSDKDGGTSVHHSEFFIDGKYQGLGLGTQHFASSVKAYQAGKRIKKITTHPGLDAGGYVWAKLGFVPTQESWEKLSQGHPISSRITGLNLPSDDEDKLMTHLDNPDPKNIWHIADHEHGRKILAGTTWHGKFDIHPDSDSVKRLNAAISSWQRARGI